MKGENRGVVLGACGDFHVYQAMRVGEEIRQIHPDLPVDLYTDAAGVALVTAPASPSQIQAVFSQIHKIETSWFRPKMDALINSRFDKTLYLDNDVFILAPFDDIFAVLDRFDIAASHDPNRAGGPANIQSGPDLPNALPQFNGGVLAVRNKAETRDFLTEWADQLRASGQGRDQPLLRRLLIESDLQIGVLPEEYNLLHTYSGYLRAWLQSPEKPAPRIYHHYPLRAEQPETALLRILGPVKYRALRQSLKRDPNIETSTIRTELRPEAVASVARIEGHYILRGLVPDVLRWLRKRLALRTRWQQLLSQFINANERQ